MSKLYQQTGRAIQNSSIRNKLIVIIMSASTIGIVVLGVSLLITDLNKLREMQRIDLDATAEIISETTSGFLAFDDANGANTLLNALKSKKELTRVILFDGSRRLFAQYQRDGVNTVINYQELNNRVNDGRYKSKWNVIRLSGEDIGYLYVEIDDYRIDEFSRSAIIALLTHVVIGLLIVYLLAFKLQKIVSVPIIHLTDTISKITEEKNYNLQAEKRSDDEIGVLTDAFNGLLKQQQLSNKELVESENKFRQVVEQSVDALFIVNDKGDIVDVNEASCESLNYTRSDLLKLQWKDVDKRFDDPIVLETLLARLKDRDRLILQGEHIGKDGTAHPVEVNVGFVKIDGKKLILASARDNTERKMSERKLQQANDQLEAKVNERTRELKRANKELSLSKERAEAASKAKSLFLANMSHEIRTPMNAVIGFTDVLASSDLSEKQATYVESIQSGSRNLLSLINDILDISKIEAGKMKIQLETVYLAELLQDIKDVFYMSAREKNLFLELTIASNVPRAILSDEVRLRQILFNLLSNAIKFTRQGGVSINVRYENIVKDDLFSDLLIEVRDTGVGVNKKDQHSIFNIFEQQDSQSTREFGGAGLGLAISTKLAERLNSVITVESEVGKGSVFKFLMKSPELADVTPVESVKIKNVGVKLKPARILIADDVSENRSLISEYLSQQEVVIYQAENGEQAVDIARKEKPDLVLMDIRMPKMSGVEAAEIIKNDKALSDVKVVAVTASVVEDKQGDKKRSMFDAVLYKPLKKSSLLNKLADLIGVKQEEEFSLADIVERFSEEMANASAEFVSAIAEYSPMLERSKNRGSFGGLNQIVDELNHLAEKFDMTEFQSVLKRLRVSNNNFDIEETQRLLTDVITGIGQTREIKYGKKI